MPVANFAHWGPTTALPYVTDQVVGYVRDANEFAINKWVQYVPVDNPQFLWYQLERDQAVRMIDKALFAWPPGTPRPTGNHNLTRFRMVNDVCERYAVPWTLDGQLVDVNKAHGAADPETVESKSTASQMMVLETNDIINMCETEANWDGSAADANTLNEGAGYWDQASDDPASPYYNAIQDSIWQAIEYINLLTNGVVRAKDLKLVLSPTSARRIGRSAEIRNYVKYNSQAGIKIIKDTMSENPSEEWTLPNRLYGLEVVIEDAVRVTKVPSTAGTQATISSGQRAFVKSADTAFITSRVGGIQAPYKTKSFSTVQYYYYKDHNTVQSRYDDWNRLTEGSVVSNFKAILAAPQSGFLIKNILTPAA